MHNAYEVIEDRRLNDLNSKGTILKHKKTGAKVVLISNDDENKVFYIGFRTPPYDSTGLPHILEHSVLCGSKRFPAKDPFIELAKGSLNTFLNAMTYPDKTVYPVASCNDKDFQNLMEVYLDAVFYPNIYEREQIFRQEGFRYELDSKDADITINGVVYNEMKGAFSTPDDILDREIFSALFPDTAYGVESGGDPDVIPELTYEKFLEFHKKYYHPSNCYIYIYGNADMAEKLDYIDREYLSKFDALEIDSKIALQKPFEKIREREIEYSITSEEPMEDNTFLSYNFVVDTSLNKELYIAFQILEYLLILAPGAILTERLLKSGIVQDVDSTYENGILQPYFSIIGRGANKENKDEFISIIKDELENAVKNGLDKKALLAAINVFEFKYREADFGRYPKGLMYGLQAFDSWLYDENSPFMHLEANDTFKYLKEKAETNYFEELINKYLLNNTHGAVVILTPKRGLTAIKDKALADKLKAYKDSLSDAEVEALVNNTAELKKYQEEPSTEEELNSIPLLEISDIKKDARKYIYKENKAGDIKLISHDIYTNGIGYVSLYFNMNKLPKENLPYVGFLANILGFVNTKNYSYAELSSEININTGGISSTALVVNDRKDVKKFSLMFKFKAKALYNKLPDAFKLIKEMALSSDYSDDDRLKELLLMIKTRMQSSFVSSGHTTAFRRAMSYCFESEACIELMSGLDFYRAMDEILDDYDSNKDILKNKLIETAKMIFRKENLIADFTGAAEEVLNVIKYTEDFSDGLFTEEINVKETKLLLEKKNEGFKTGAKVQYVAIAGDYMKDSLEYTGALRVLKVIMGYDYLWNNVRVLGGAYGCMSGFTQTGKGYFVSYRDPNLEKTLDVYKNTVNYLKNFNASDRDMTKYIIGSIAEIDTPLTPAQEGAAGFEAYYANRTNEDAKRERDEMISCSVDDIRKLAPYAEAILNENCICVVGAEEKILENKHLFNNIEDLV